eukprot:gene9958-2136_t
MERAMTRMERVVREYYLPPIGHVGRLAECADWTPVEEVEGVAVEEEAEAVAAVVVVVAVAVAVAVIAEKGESRTEEQAAP